MKRLPTFAGFRVLQYPSMASLYGAHTLVQHPFIKLSSVTHFKRSIFFPAGTLAKTVIGFWNSFRRQGSLPFRVVESYQNKIPLIELLIYLRKEEITSLLGVMGQW